MAQMENLLGCGRFAHSLRIRHNALCRRSSGGRLSDWGSFLLRRLGGVLMVAWELGESRHSWVVEGVRAGGGWVLVGSRSKV